MSLFKINEYFSTNLVGASCIHCVNLIGKRDQLIVGGENGFLTVFDPGEKEKEQDATIVQQETGRPVIEIQSGEFLPGTGMILAILSSSTLSYYKLIYDEQDPSRTRLNELFVHSLQEGAYNMCLVQTPNHATQILVQSVGSDQVVFSRSSLPSLHPGPLCYCLPSSSLITVNGGFINSVKFSLLASGSNTGKKITFDWTMNLGDNAISLATQDMPPVQPSIIVLCRRTMYCFTSGGIIRWQVRFECIATALCVYRVPETDNATIRSVVATNINTLLIYADSKLIWNCQTQEPPVQLLVSSYRFSKNSIFLIPKIQVPADNRFVDFKAKITEMREMEAKVKDTSNVEIKSSPFNFDVKLGELERSSIDYSSKGDAPVCPVHLTFHNLRDSDQIFLNIECQMATPSKQIVIERARDGTNINFGCYVGEKLPTSTQVTIVAHAVPGNFSFYKQLRLPLGLMFHSSSPDRNAKYKVILEIDQAMAPLNQLYADLHAENPQSLGLRVYGYDATVSIFGANKSSRYRIQSEYPSLLNVVVTDLGDRLMSNLPGVNISGNLPIEYASGYLEEYFGLEDKYSNEKKQVEARSKEVRAIEALLLSKAKNAKLDDVTHVETLLDKAHETLIALIDQLCATQKRMESARQSLCSLLNLAATIMRWRNLEATIDGDVITNTQQSIRERLSWLAGSRDATKIIENLCMTATNKDMGMIEEKEEEEEDDTEKLEQVARGEVPL
ncbi:hypothetical protein WR25_17570 [Diploscapter pachys]|uniref:PTHB1 N-terminal domain-containing protein n=1 Tax=Diploscapter pachys TaxID=2018661 RepID=A0A2A2KQQ9_9BILA|nr:hypothetical protein WR25_17570 [Diploscapter pachys]